MIATIARKEVIEIYRDGRLRALVLTIVTLAMLSFCLGLASSLRAHAEIDEARRMTRLQWLDQDPKNPHAAAHFGVWAFRPRPLAAALEDGLDPFLGVAVWLEAHKQNDFRFRPARDETAVVRFGRASVAGVLGLLLPLLVAAVAAPVFAREKERGTLRQLASLGIAPYRLAAGKILGVLFALLVVLVPVLVLCALALSLFGSGEAERTGLRAALMAGVFTLYLVGLACFTLFISALFRKSPAALGAVFLFWAADMVVLPRALCDFSRARYPSVTATAFAKQMQDEISHGPSGHDPYDARLEALKQGLLAKYRVTRIEDLPMNFDGVALQYGEEVGNAVFDYHYGALYAHFQAQRRFEEYFAPLVPLVAVRSLSMALAGTDLAHQQHFVMSAEHHRRLLVKTMNDAMTYSWKHGDWESEAGKETWAKVPDFNYVAPSLRAALGAQTHNFLGLLAFIGLCLGALLIATRRWRP